MKKTAFCIALQLLSTVSSASLINDITTRYHVDVMRNDKKERERLTNEWSGDLCMFQIGIARNSLSLKNVCQRKEDQYYFNDKLENSITKTDENLGIELEIDHRDHKNSLVELQLLRLRDGSRPHKGQRRHEEYHDPRLTFGIHLKNGHDLSLRVSFRKDDQIWEHDHHIEDNGDLYFKTPHLYSFEWYKDDSFKIRIDNQVVDKGSISQKFSSKEFRQAGCGSNKDMQLPNNLYYNINYTLVRELNTMPRFIGSDKKQINEEYIYKRILAEKTMRNENYKELPKVENKLSPKQSNDLGDTVSSIGFRMNSDGGEIHISRILIGEIKEETKYRN
ncbi:UNKNOWN [Stylonychia lemnae]|uniref:Uncharacterized protein n=1 Tax=Stylonychia lemnae TaxID=5949 RepID=A0A078ACN3_STYLE|nr:UNKNOWN [Stylonychia lemnae]|eukprot:CDW78598.1 UNKNOWN [Stylonychia lemnae]